jgi:CheY-like chemotaxis protein
MLAYSGRGRLTNKPIELDALVRETTQLLGLSMSKTTQLQLLLGAEGIFVQGDPVQLQQVIMNLVLNASEACEDKAGLIKVTTGRESPNRSSEPRVDRVLDILDGEFLFLEVADNGAGMTPQTQARMFDPFFTTKFTGRGLGLSAVLGIIRGHAGGVGVESELGRGTTFRVLLPIVNAEQALLASATPSTPAPALHTTGTILVVDDEELVRKVAVSVLESLGLKVVTAGNGREGVERVLASNPPFAAVLMDLTMPVLDGVSAIDELRRAQNPVPVILMSGYSEQDAGARFADKGVAGFLQKPFTPQMVSQQLALVLRR